MSLFTINCKWNYSEHELNGKYYGYNNHYFEKMIVLSNLR